MGAAWTLGPHRVSFAAPDLVRLVTVGPLDRKLLKDLEALVEDLQARYPVLYLISDVRQCSGMAPELRGSIAEDVERAPFAGMVILGASFALRTLATTLHRTSRLGELSDPKPFVLVETEAEAMAWVSSWRDADSRVLKTG